MTNPLTQLYTAIVETLAASDDFTALVKEKNRIVYTGTRRDPEKHSVQDADFPEVRLTPTGGEYGPERDTDGRTWIERYQILVATGEQRVDTRLFPVRWAIVRALADWQRILGELTWMDETFVLDFDVQSSDVGASEVDMRRGIDGWAAVVNLEAKMWFSHDNLKGI